MYPLGFGLPEDVAHACTYLLSDAATRVTGTNIVVDGGYRAR
jgi:NAD(P)-dependent dehydrogenase (short-subunit alcohol dehydrogenase family)